MFRDRFWITLLLCIPTMMWSEMIQAWFGYRAPSFAGSAYVPVIFGIAVYLYEGSVFLAGAVEIKLADFEQRSLFEKVIERGARLISRVL